MKNAAAYIRVSTDDQVEFSPDSQIRAIRKYADEHGLLLRDEFIFADEGISGRRVEKRPAFQKMIGTAKLRPKPFDVILLWKFSRFARNREDSIVYKSMLRKQCGIDVISVSEQLSEDKTSILIEALIEAMDEYYSLNLAEEVRRGMDEKFSRGGVVSQPPFGYRMGGGIFVEDGDRAEVVRMMFGDLIGGMNVRQIAQKLNDMGIRSRNGKLFESRTVEYILSNPVYIGKLRRSKNGRSAGRFYQDGDNTVLVDGAHKPLVSEEVFREAEVRLGRLRQVHVPYERCSPADFMLKGLVRCGCCGGTLVRHGASGSLQCHRYSKGTCAVSHSVKIEKLSGIVMDRVAEDVGGSSFEVSICNVPERSGETDKALAEAIAREEKKLSRIREAFLSGVDSIEEYRENKRFVLAAIDRLRGQIGADKAADVPVRGKVRLDFGMIAELGSEGLKNAVLRRITQSIVFDRQQDEVRIFYRL